MTPRETLDCCNEPTILQVEPHGQELTAKCACCGVRWIFHEWTILVGRKSRPKLNGDLRPASAGRVLRGETK